MESIRARSREKVREIVKCLGRRAYLHMIHKCMIIRYACNKPKLPGSLVNSLEKPANVHKPCCMAYTYFHNIQMVGSSESKDDSTII